MAIKLFEFSNHPHDFAVTTCAEVAEECAFLLDFSRALKPVRWLGFVNSRIGLTMVLWVPVVHHTQNVGELAIRVWRGEPHFARMKKLWRQHYRSERSLRSEVTGGLDIVGDFQKHFPDEYL